MPLIIAFETFLMLSVLFVKSFIAPSASVASITLHVRRYFELSRTLHNCLAVFVKEVQGLFAVLWVPVVPSCEVILQVHF